MIVQQNSQQRREALTGTTILPFDNILSAKGTIMPIEKPSKNVETIIAQQPTSKP